MKIGILTFHAAFNYGSMLQAYALQTFLQNLGHEVKIINFRSDNQQRMYRKPFSKLSLRYIGSDIKRLIKYGSNYLNTRTRWEKFNEFLKTHLILTKEYDVNNYKDAGKDFDCIITGSDQIWNLNAYDFSEAYFGVSIGGNTKLIAYGPSLGPNPEKLDTDRLRGYLKRFSAVSVRENRARDYLIRNSLYPKVETVLDPTMLIDSSQYYKLLESEKIHIGYPYIYYYTPDNHPEILKKSLEITNCLDIPVAVDTGYFNNSEGITNPRTLMVTSAGPLQFLSYIKKAKIVVGASFHLIVFAILFHKEFVCINGDKDSRLSNLLHIFGLEDRSVSVKDLDFNLNNIKPVNWILVDEKVNKLRTKSAAFLKSNL